MNTPYRPIFIFFSLIFIGVGFYFFYALKTGYIYKEISKNREAEEIIDENIEIYNQAINEYDSHLIFSLNKDQCLLQWKVKVNGRFNENNLELIYDSNNKKTCLLDFDNQFPYHLSILKKIFHDHDRRQIKYFHLKNISSWSLKDDKAISAFNELIKTEMSQPQIVAAINKSKILNILDHLFKSFKSEVVLVSFKQKIEPQDKRLKFDFEDILFEFKFPIKE